MSKSLLFTPAAGPDWEVWALGGSPGREEPRFEQATADLASAAGSASEVVMALPVGQCFTFAIWLMNAADPALHEPMILSQLEKRGMVPRNGPAPVFDFVAVATAENRTLFRVTLLPASFPEALCFPNAKSYVASADILPLPPNRIVLWQERQNLVLAATREREPVHTQIIGRSLEITSHLASEIHAIRLALELEEIVGKIEGITVWGGSAMESGCLRSLNLPVDLAPGQAERPAPDASRVAIASTRSRLLPPSLQAARAARSRRGRSRRLALIAAAAYAVVVCVLWLYLHFMQAKVAALSQAAAADAPVAAELEKTAAAWRAVEPAVDPAFYPIEQFYQISTLLPPVGIRLATFETQGTDIRLKGTARNASTVFGYVDALRKSRKLANYHWKVGQPKLQKDDTAEFRIEGSLKYGPVK